MSTLPRLYAGPTAAFSPDFDTVYGITSDGAILAPDGMYLPTVEHDDVHDILIDGGPTLARSNGSFDVNSGWDALTGHTGQYGYSGPVMHASEQWGPWAVEDLTRLADAPGVAFLAFAVVVVEAPCSDADPCFPDEPEHCREYGCDATPAGWAVIYREVSA